MSIPLAAGRSSVRVLLAACSAASMSYGGTAHTISRRPRVRHRRTADRAQHTHDCSTQQRARQAAQDGFARGKRVQQRIEEGPRLVQQRAHRRRHLSQQPRRHTLHQGQHCAPDQCFKLTYRCGRYSRSA
jgi:hypothetical protein